MQPKKTDYKPLELFAKTKTDVKIDDNLRLTITVKRKKGMYLYNYSNRCLVDRNHPILIMCRGLILNKQGKVLNRPFDRFFNHFEKEANSIDWATAEIQEKIDGSLISVFVNNQNQWEITTRGSFYPNPKSNTDFAQMFRRFFTQFDRLNRNYCYMFELVTKENPVVKYYQDEFIVLLGIRDLRIDRELNQIKVDDIATQLQIRRPERYQATNLQAALSLFKNFDADDEGLVIVDRQSNRLKLKQDSYFKLSKIKQLREQDILDYVRGHTEIDEELIQRDKIVMEKVTQIQSEYDAFLAKVYKTFQEINTPIRKTFAIAAQAYPFKALLFLLYDDREFSNKKLTYENIKAGLQ